MEHVAQATIPERQVSAALAIGVLLAPPIFVWLLLRKGYRTTARVVGFAWSATILAIGFIAEPPPAEVQKAASTNVAEQRIPNMPIQQVPAKGRQRPPTEAELQQFRRLYEQLQSFRRDQAFLDVGFDPCCRFYRWLQDVKALNDQSGSAIFQHTRVLPGDLQTLAYEYRRNGGKSKNLAAYFESEFEFALNRKSRPKGQGVVIKQTIGCRSFELFAQWLRLSEEQAQAAASSVIEGPGCERVLIGTRIGPVLAKNAYRFRSGDALNFVQVQLAGGRKIWLSEDEVEFS